MIGKIIDSAIIGCIAYVVCVILQIPSAFLVAFIIGVTNIIPFFGPFIGAVPSILLVLIQSPIHGLYLAIFILVLQQVDGNIIGPKILGDKTGLDEDIRNRIEELEKLPKPALTIENLARIIELWTNIPASKIKA